jgi:hypothetical protein
MLPYLLNLASRATGYSEYAAAHNCSWLHLPRTSSTARFWLIPAKAELNTRKLDVSDSTNTPFRAVDTIMFVPGLSSNRTRGDDSVKSNTVYQWHHQDQGCDLGISHLCLLWQPYYLTKIFWWSAVSTHPIEKPFIPRVVMI